jgi:hypothetical protein
MQELEDEFELSLQGVAVSEGHPARDVVRVCFRGPVHTAVMQRFTGMKRWSVFSGDDKVLFRSLQLRDAAAACAAFSTTGNAQC